jgi:threonine dehydratase
MTMVEQRRITVEGIARAARGISAEFLHTPVVRHDDLNDWLGARVSCKVESLGPLRSFKGRGGDWFMRQRSGKSPVCAASAGNFGQALAYASRNAGVQCTMFASVHASALKLARMRALGATVIQDGEDFDAAKDAARAFGAAHGIEFVEDGKAVAISEGAGSIAVDGRRGDVDESRVAINARGGRCGAGRAEHDESTHGGAGEFAGPCADYCGWHCGACTSAGSGGGFARVGGRYRRGG